MNIWFKRGMWRVRDNMDKLHKFSSEEEAKAFAEGVEMPSVPPLPEVREYDSLEEAMADQDTDDLDLYEEELIAEED